MLEPQGHDSFFRWGFFNSVLEKKEAYSDYVFEDHALELLRDEPELKAKFDAWKGANVALVSDQPNSERDHFVGINNTAAGRTAGVLMGRFLPQNQGKVLVVAASMLA